MSATKLLDRLEQQGLLDESLIADLRRQVEQSTSPITPEAIVKLLVDNGHLTKFQATKLVSDVTSAREAQKEARSKQVAEAKEQARQKKAQDKAARPAPPPTDAAADEELGFAPDEDEEEVILLEDASVSDLGDDLTLLEDADGLTPLDDAGGLTPLDDAAGLTPLDDAGGLTPITDGSLAPLDSSEGLTPLQDDGQLRPAEETAPAQPPPVQTAGLTPQGAGPPGGVTAASGTAAGSGLDDLLEDPLMAEAATAEGGMLPARPAKKGWFGGGQAITGPKKKLMRANPWDSPLLLVGGGLLMLLLVALVYLYLSLTRGTAAELLALAEEDYRSQSYTQAIDKYNKFLKRYPNHPEVSKARVRSGMARLRQAVEASSDPLKGLESARSILPEIEGEEAFSEARFELSTLLPDIAEAFAQKAQAAGSYTLAEQLLQQAEQSMELVNNASYIPTTLRRDQAARISDIDELMALVRREINRDKKLVQAVEAIREAIAAGATRQAYTVREELLMQYPGLEANEQLVEAVQQITQRQRDLVQQVDASLTPVTEDEPQATEHSVVLSSRSGPGVTGVEEQVALVLAGGAVYGLDAASGRVLWRRFVGHDTPFHPVPVSQQVDADALLVDGRRKELVRVQAKTGKPAWRLPVGEQFAHPAVAGDRIVLTTRSGLVYSIDAQTGQATAKAAKLPENLPLGAGLDARRPQIYQLGEHDNLYVLSADTLQCKEVLYLGHKPGTIATGPVMALGHLLVAENAGPSYCKLHIIATNRDGLKLKPAQAPIRLKGHVLVRPLVSGRRVVVVTDLGAIHVFDVNPQSGEAEEPVTDAVIPLVATHQQPLVGYPLVDGGSLWVGDNRLAKYEIQVSQQKLNRVWRGISGDSFVAPLQRFGEAIITVRRSGDAPGITVAAVHQDDHKKRLWTAELAVPAAQVLVDPQRGDILSVSARGEVAQINDEILAKGYAEAPGRGEGSMRFDQAVPIQDGRIAFFSPSKRILLYDPAQDVSQMQLLPLDIPSGEATAAPITVSGGLLVPLDRGEVVLLDVGTGGNLVLPFHPPLKADARINWHRPAVVGADDGQFAIADDRQNLYLVGVVRQGQPHLAEVARITLDDEIISPLAAAGDTLYAVVRGARGDVLVSFEVPKLTAGKRWQLQGRVLWGPERVGEVVLLATDSEGLLCFEAGQKQRWASPLKHGPLAGRPLADGNDFLLASISGTVWRIAGDSGQQLAQGQVDEPLGGGPVAFGQRVLLSGSDGTLHVIPALATSAP